MTDQANAPATPTVTLDPHPDKMSPVKAKIEARQLRGQDGWTVAELKRRYGSRWSTDWLEGIPAPVSPLSAKQQEKATKLAAPKSQEAPMTETTRPPVARENERVANGGVERTDQNAIVEADAAKTAKPAKPSGAAGSRPDASKPKPAPRTVSKAQAARESVARAKAAKAAAEQAKTQATLEAAAAKAAKDAKPKTSKPSTPKTSKPPQTGKVSAAKLSNDGVRLIRSLWDTMPKPEIVAALKQQLGVEVDEDVVTKIGSWATRTDVPPVAKAKKVS
jgi:hypothetical protein